MSRLEPSPLPPNRMRIAEDDSLRRIHLRLWQILLTAVTVGITAWFASFGIIPAIVALMVAKHVLVALLMIGLEPRSR
jgi:hypothetical protein